MFNRIKKVWRTLRSGDDKNAALLASFTLYCRAHPEHRFWQALRNWSEANRILYSDVHDLPWEEPHDTFYWEDRTAAESLKAERSEIPNA